MRTWLVLLLLISTALKKQKRKEPNKFIEENTVNLKIALTGLFLHPIKEFLERYLAQEIVKYGGISVSVIGHIYRYEVVEDWLPLSGHSSIETIVQFFVFEQIFKIHDQLLRLYQQVMVNHVQMCFAIFRIFFKSERNSVGHVVCKNMLIWGEFSTYKDSRDSTVANPEVSIGSRNILPLAS
jgi:hypothetical protein